ncbi:hypothetical protein JW758_03465 [Candidatus Peregrinibacteria bacterium]|nr:hypothetical protein [Candidatus Peregrinibacteria bacterium]
MKVKKQGRKKQEGITTLSEKGLKEEVRNSLLEKVISLGIESYIEIIESEITAICGERYKHITGREFTRWSSKETLVILGGQKIPVSHSRVRNIKDRKEKEIESITRYKDKELLSHRQMEQMIIGVYTRKYKRSLETAISGMEPYSNSKSTVSRNFIAKTTEKLEA